MKFFHFIHSPLAEVFQEEKRWSKKNLLTTPSSLHSLSFNAKTTPSQSIVDEIQAYSLLQQQQQQIIFIYNYLSLKESGIQEIFLKNDDKYIFLLEKSSNPPSPIVQDFCFKNSNYTKLIHKPYGLSEREIQNWILDFLQENRINLTSEARKSLLQWAYIHPDKIELELEKFLCYTLNPTDENPPTIDQLQIQTLFTYTEKSLPFDLAESFFSGDAEKSLLLLYTYTFSNPIPLGSQKFLGVISLLLKESMILLDLIKEPSPSMQKNILANYQVRGQKRIQKILSFSSKFSKNPNQLRKIAVWLANFESLLKSQPSFSSFFPYCIPNTLFFQKMILSCKEK